jgi:mono/diheme cytochrome c family protein
MLAATTQLCALIFIVLARSGVAAEPAVSFRRDIAPVLHRRCTACHGEESVKGGYRLDTFARLLQPGDTELPPVTSGNPEDSELYRLLIEPDPHDRMPQKADPLPPQEIALVERWLRQGARYDGGAEDRPLVELARETFLRAAPETYSRPAPVTALAFSPDGRQLAVCGYYELTLWTVEGTKLERRIGGLPERVNSIAWHRDGRSLAVAGGSPGRWGTVMLLDLTSDAAPRVLCDLPDTAQAVAFSTDGGRLVAACGDRTVRVFDTATGRQERVLRHHADWVQSVASQPGGKLALSISRDRTARVFDPATGEVEAAYQEHGTPLAAAAFTPDGGRVISAGRSRELHVWEARSGDRRGEIKELSARPQQIATGRFGVLTSTADHLLHVYDLGGRSKRFTLIGHHDEVQALAVSPDEQWIASGSQDGEVLIWELHCGTWVQRWVPSLTR